MKCSFKRWHGMAWHGIVPDVDWASIVVVTMEHIAAASTAIEKLPRRSPSQMTIVICEP